MAGTPSAAPGRATRASSRASGTSALPLLLGGHSSAYGSPAQARLASATPPSERSTNLYQGFSAKGDHVGTSELDPTYSRAVAAGKAAPKASKATPKATSKRNISSAHPSPITEEAEEDDEIVPAQNTTGLFQQHHGHPAPPADNGNDHLDATPPANLQVPPEPAWSFRTSRPLRRCGAAAIFLALSYVLTIIFLPWLPFSGEGGVFQELKYQHDRVAVFFPNCFGGGAGHADNGADLSRISRQIWDLQQEQALLKRHHTGSDSVGAGIMAKNYFDALNNPNFFNFKEGATIDHLLTSPTRKPQGPTLLEKVILGYYPRVPNAPVTAILPWDEAGDCWCAPPTNEKSGKIQLAVNLVHNVIPESIVVEHPPFRGLLTPGSAPKDLELWVQVKDEGLRQEVERAAGAPDPATQGLPWDFVRVAAFTYNIHPADGNHVQTFKMAVGLEAFEEKGFAITKAVVRVGTNYGADYTCMYRLRLYGKKVDGDGKAGE
ncbi:hypothetical protein FH972_022357 [Carpinus fangiana]|uniref:SUN domain-containing protein n=1 Tax=Carpinus fangiana TaxID=176857 RepID=A0A5N6KSE2_9ROSI|nr:hypothetical protein FH972_022357 [Carpinus fangiana]